MIRIVHLTLILILICTTDQSLSCSRIYSKTARDILKESGFLELLETSTPLATCTLSLSRDVFRHQENQKSLSSPNHWICGFCGKAFKAEHYLDKHFDLKHNDKKDSADNSSCLGDHCEWLRCEILNRWYVPSYWDRALCNQKELDKLTVMCINALSECFDDEEILDASISMLCNKLTCNEYYIDDGETFHNYVLHVGRLFMFIITCFIVCFLYLVVIPLISTVLSAKSTTTPKMNKHNIKNN